MAKTKREGISKKTRFEVFKRDKFTCQYCGKKAPDVVLHVDHIKPVADGGKSDILNLVAACVDCNSGKGARKLSDNAVLDAQRAQLEALQQRREQLEMLIEWRDELADFGTTKAVAMERAICDEFGWPGIKEKGIVEIRKWLKKFELSELLTALDAAVAGYIKYDDDGEITDESANKAFYYIPRIASVKRAEQTKPWLRDAAYIKGIIRNRLSYVGWERAAQLLEEAFEWGANADDLKSIAKYCRNWTGWQSEMEDHIRQLSGGK